MSDVKTTTTVWRCLDAQWVDGDPTCSVIALTMQSNGKEYAVVCSGPKGMKSNEFISAIRAAAASLIAAAGGDLKDTGCSAANDSTFDTGDQRAN
jgi:hypothetical protein